MNTTKNTFTYDDAESLVYAIDTALSRVGLTIEVGSAFDECRITVLRLAAQHRKEHAEVDNSVDIRPDFRDFVGLVDFAAKLYAVSDNSAFADLKPHLELLNKGKVVQNSRNLMNDDINNKLFELYVACLCIAAGATDVHLDHPKNSNGNNPDVIATFDGVVWGFACKALNSSQGMSAFENLEKAVRQIERAPVAIGIPVLSIKNILPHDELWVALDDPNHAGEYIFTAGADSRAAVSMMVGVVDRLCTSITEAAGEAGLKELFVGKKSVPGFFALAAAVTSTVHAGSIVSTRLNLASVHGFEPLDEATNTVISRLHYQFQAILPPQVAAVG
jgi:hypothetical protein